MKEFHYKRKIFNYLPIPAYYDNFITVISRCITIVGLVKKRRKLKKYIEVATKTFYTHQ